MNQPLPKVDRAKLRAQMLALVDRLVEEVADAVDEAPAGRVIRNSEERARQALDEFRREVYQLVVQAKVDAMEAAFPPPTSAATAKPMRHKGRQAYSLVTVCGKLRIWRVRWHDAAEGSQTPLDQVLDEAEQTISEGVREMLCRVNQCSSSFAATVATLKRTAQIVVSKETARRVIEAEGQQVLKQMRGGQLGPQWSWAECRTAEGVTRLYLGCDGVKIPLVTDGEKKLRRERVKAKRRGGGRKRKPLPRAKRGADCAYKEFKVGYIYDQSKRRRYVGVTSGNHEAAGRMLARMADQVEWKYVEERVALIDGAPWIRSQIEFHGLTDQIGLDFYHLQENVQKARKVVFGEESEDGRSWVAEVLHAFKEEGYVSGWDRLVETWQGVRSGPKRAALRGLMQYVSEREGMIRYPQFRRRGWDIGSGPTESECKTTTGRVKGRGRRWDSNHAEAMMALAALHDSRLWEQYWQTLAPQPP